MKKKSCISMILSAALLCSACGGKQPSGQADQTAETSRLPSGGSAQQADTKEAGASSADPATSLSGVRPEETVTLEVYSQLSGYQGEQQGWFAQILLDKFNVKLDFIYDGSDDFYAWRE